MTFLSELEIDSVKFCLFATELLNRAVVINGLM